MSFDPSPAPPRGQRAPLSSSSSRGGGYLDETDASRRGTLLFQHLQNQPYLHRIRASSDANAAQAADDDDDVLDDDEVRRETRIFDALADLDDEESSVTTWDSEEEERKMQQEWEENIAQLNIALQVMVLPFFGKWLGRKWSYWAFTRYQQRGLTAAFFGLEWIWAPTTIVPNAAVALLD